MTNSNTVTEAHPVSVIGALKQGFSAALGHLWISLVFWGVSLLLALLAALPFRSLLLGEAGNSLMVKDLMKGFDYTFLNDFMQSYGAGFTPVLNQSVLLLGLQYLLLIFLVGGLVKVLWGQPQLEYRSIFWSGAGTYFWRMLRLSVFFLLIHGLVLVVFGFLYFKVVKGFSPQALESEGIITSSLSWLVPLYVLVAALPMMWQDYAKVFLVKNNNRFIWSSIGEGGRFVIRHFAKTYPLYLLNMVLVLVLFMVNYFLVSLFDISSLGTIIGTFLLSQLFVFVRYAMKMVNQGSIVALMRQIESL